MLREKDVSVATLDDVMARTRISKSQLFHYFPEGKDELLLAVAHHEAAQVLEEQQPGSRPQEQKQDRLRLPAHRTG